MAKAKPKKKAVKKTVKAKARSVSKAKTTKKTVRAASKSDSFKGGPIGQKQTKTQIMTALSEMSELSKKEVETVLKALGNLVERHLKPRGSGEFTIPEVAVKVRRVTKKATKARKGVNPFTGEEIMISAKPARKAVKVAAMKALKEMV